MARSCRSRGCRDNPRLPTPSHGKGRFLRQAWQDAQMHIFDKVNHFVWPGSARGLQQLGDMVPEKRVGAGFKPACTRTARSGDTGSWWTSANAGVSCRGLDAALASVRRRPASPGRDMRSRIRTRCCRRNGPGPMASHRTRAPSGVAPRCPRGFARRSRWWRPAPGERSRRARRRRAWTYPTRTPATGGCWSSRNFRHGPGAGQGPALLAQQALPRSCTTRIRSSPRWSGSGLRSSDSP